MQLTGLGCRNSDTISTTRSNNKQQRASQHLPSRSLALSDHQLEQHTADLAPPARHLTNIDVALLVFTSGAVQISAELTKFGLRRDRHMDRCAQQQKNHREACASSCETGLERSDRAYLNFFVLWSKLGSWGIRITEQQRAPGAQEKKHSQFRRVAHCTLTSAGSQALRSAERPDLPFGTQTGYARLSHPAWSVATYSRSLRGRRP